MVVVADRTVDRTAGVVVARIAGTGVGHTDRVDHTGHILRIVVVEVEDTGFALVPVEGDMFLAEQEAVGEDMNPVDSELEEDTMTD